MAFPRNCGDALLHAHTLLQGLLNFWRTGGSDLGWRGAADQVSGGGNMSIRVLFVAERPASSLFPQRLCKSAGTLIKCARIAA